MYRAKKRFRASDDACSLILLFFDFSLSDIIRFPTNPNRLRFPNRGQTLSNLRWKMSLNVSKDLRPLAKMSLLGIDYLAYIYELGFEGSVKREVIFSGTRAFKIKGITKR